MWLPSFYAEFYEVPAFFVRPSLSANGVYKSAKQILIYNNFFFRC